MLQDPPEQIQQQLNLDDVVFADTNAPRIHDEWKAKFLAGAAEHGGIGKPSLVERKGLIRDVLCEQYDGISYILAIEKRVKLAKAKLAIVKNTITSVQEVNDTGVVKWLDEAIDLLS